MSDTLTIPNGGRTVLDERVVTFVRPLIGFGGTLRYAVRSLGEAYEPFAAMTSLDEEGLGFIVVPPGLVFRDYVVEISDAEVALLELGSSEDAEVLALVTRHPGTTPTANLMGPVVVNRRTRRAAQVVLQDPAYGVAVALDASSARA